MGNVLSAHTNSSTTATGNSSKTEGFVRGRKRRRGRGRPSRVLFLLHRTWAVIATDKWTRSRLSRSRRTVNTETWSDYESQYSFCTCSQCQRDDGFSSGCASFPTDKDLKKQWMDAFWLTKVQVFVSSKVCSDHFLENDFIDNRQGGGLRVLKKGSIPSVTKKHMNSRNKVITGNEHGGTSNTSESSVATSSSLSVEPATQDTLTEAFFVLPKKDKTLCDGKREEIRSVIGLDEQQTSIIAETLVKNKSLNTDICRSSSSKRNNAFRYIGDLGSPDCKSPGRAKSCLNFAKSIIEKQRKQVKSEKEKNKRLIKKLTTFKALVQTLRKKNLFTEDAAGNLMTSIPETVQEIVKRNLRNKKKKYDPKLRSYALTLNFYSSKAYRYVRSKFKNLLPAPSTIRHWYSVINGQPGFTQEAFQVLRQRSNISPCLINIVIDEMSIRQQLIYDKHSSRFYGCVDLGIEGTNMNTDNCQEATHALLFLAVALNADWKLPLGYFLIGGLSGSERANLLNKCLELVNNTKAVVASITFDGAHVNGRLCTELGAKLDYETDFQPCFKNPVDNSMLYLLFDPCHMLKLVRNTLGDRQILYNQDGKIIKWQHIVNLFLLQKKEGLHPSTKLTNKHVYYDDNKMSVKLATQTLSESVAKALQFAIQLELQGFEDAEGTAEFCQNFNDIFDIFNCRSKYSKKSECRLPLNETNYLCLQQKAINFERYISGLRDETGKLLIHSARKTGFLGLIICLRNLFPVYNFLQKKGLKYLLTYKLLQDHIETFFSAVRSCGGFNNNPNAKQFEAAYKRLLIHNDITGSAGGNCLLSNIKILHVSSSSSAKKDENNSVIIDYFDGDYISKWWELSHYVDNVVKYIAGVFFESVSSMPPNSEDNGRICHFPFGDDGTNKEKQRPPIYNPEDYALSLKKWGRKPPNGAPGLYTNAAVSETNICARSRSDSFRDYRNPMLLTSMGCEMTLRQFGTVSELLAKLKADLRLAYPSFVQEFVSDPLDGVGLLLELLRIIQQNQINGGGAGTSNTTGKIPPAVQRKALLDELSCLQCLLSCCTRYSEAVRKLTATSAGLYTLALCIMSNVNKSRVIALQLLAKACSPDGNGHSAVSEALSTLRLRFGEPVRFRFLVGMLNSAGGQGELLAAGMNFLNTFLNTAGSAQKRLYIQAELEQAGFDITNIKKNITINSTSAEQIFEELDTWEKNHIDVDTLTIRLEDAEKENDSLRDKVLLLERKIQILQEEKGILISLEQCLKERCSELQGEVTSLKSGKSPKSTSRRGSPKRVSGGSTPAEDEGISSSERSLTPEEDAQRESSIYEVYSLQSETIPMRKSSKGSNNKDKANDDEEETTIEEVMEELRNIINDAESEEKKKEKVRKCSDESKTSKIQMRVDNVVIEDTIFNDESEIVPSNLHPQPPRRTRSLVHLYIPAEDYECSNKEMFFENETAYTSEEGSDSLLSASKCQLPRIDKEIQQNHNKYYLNDHQSNQCKGNEVQRRCESFRHTVPIVQTSKMRDNTARHSSFDGMYLITDYENTPLTTGHQNEKHKTLNQLTSERIKSKSLDRIEHGLDSMIDIVVTDQKVDNNKSKVTPTSQYSRSISSVFINTNKDLCSRQQNDEKQKMFLPTNNRPNHENEAAYYFPRLQEKRNTPNSFLIKRGHTNAGLYSGQVIRENFANTCLKSNYGSQVSSRSIIGKVTDLPSGLY